VPHWFDPGSVIAKHTNWIYLKVGARWGLGFRKGLERHYPTCAEPFARGTEALGAEKGERASGRQGCKKSGPTAHPRAAIAKDTPGAIEASMPVPLKAGLLEGEGSARRRTRASSFTYKGQAWDLSRAGRPP
jgi:hypothetical protein